MKIIYNYVPLQLFIFILLISNSFLTVPDNKIHKILRNIISFIIHYW